MAIYHGTNTTISQLNEIYSNLSPSLKSNSSVKFYNIYDSNLCPYPQGINVILSSAASNPHYSDNLNTENKIALCAGTFTIFGNEKKGGSLV